MRERHDGQDSALLAADIFKREIFTKIAVVAIRDQIFRFASKFTEPQTFARLACSRVEDCLFGKEIEALRKDMRCTLEAAGQAPRPSSKLTPQAYGTTASLEALGVLLALIAFGPTPQAAMQNITVQLPVFTDNQGNGYALNRLTMTMTMTHSEESYICQMKAWPSRQECRGHDPTKKNLLCC